MTALHTTTTDLGQFLTGLIAKPVKAKVRRVNADAANAVKAAWASYKAWEVDYEKRLGEPVGRFCKGQFAMYLRHAWSDIKVDKRGPVTLTRDEVLYIGSDCR